MIILVSRVKPYGCYSYEFSSAVRFGFRRKCERDPKSVSVMLRVVLAVVAGLHGTVNADVLSSRTMDRRLAKSKEKEKKEKKP